MRRKSPTPVTAAAAMPKRAKMSKEAASMLPENSPASMEILSWENWKCLKQGIITANSLVMGKAFALDYEVKITSSTPVVQSLQIGSSNNKLASQSKQFPNMFLLRNGNLLSIVVVRAGRVWLIEAEVVNETTKESKEIEFELNNARLLRQTEDNVLQWEQMPSGAPLAFYLQDFSLICTILL